MKTISVKQVLESTPCEEYTPEVILNLAAGRKTVTLDEILELNLPIPDLLWVLLREPFLSEEQLYDLAHEFYLSVEDLGNSAARQTLLASKGDFNEDHFAGFDDNVRNRFNTMSEGTRRAMYAATCAIRAKLKVVRATTAFALDLIQDSFRSSQLNLVIKKIKER